MCKHKHARTFSDLGTSFVTMTVTLPCSCTSLQAYLINSQVILSLQIKDFHSQHVMFLRGMAIEGFNFFFIQLRIKLLLKASLTISGIG